MLRPSVGGAANDSAVSGRKICEFVPHPPPASASAATAASPAFRASAATGRPTSCATPAAPAFPAMSRWLLLLMSCLRKRTATPTRDYSGRRAIRAAGATAAPASRRITARFAPGARPTLASPPGAAGRPLARRRPHPLARPAVTPPAPPDQFGFVLYRRVALAPASALPSRWPRAVRVIVLRARYLRPRETATGAI